MRLKSRSMTSAAIRQLRPMRKPVGIRAPLPTTVIPDCRLRGWVRLGRVSVPSPRRTSAPTTTFLSRIARSMTLPGPTMQSGNRMLHRTVDDRAVRDQAAQDPAAVGDARRRALLRAGVDDPVGVVQVEVGR